MIGFKLLLNLLVSPLIASSTIVHNAQTVAHIPARPSNGTSAVQFTSSLFDFDGPKVGNFNDTTWDWWYFDVFSPSSNASVVVIFFASTTTGFPFEQAANLTSAVAQISLADGTVLAPLRAEANGAAVTTERGRDGASGVWKGSGFSFKSEDDMKTYTVSVDSPELGVKGDVVLTSAAPAHYPCTSNIPNSTMQIIPFVGWANSLPDSNATASFSFNNTTNDFAFADGIGYHDQNWGSRPFTNSTQAWYWGHGRLGPYSLVWFDAADWSNAEYVSGYVAKDGVILSAGCHAGSVRVRPRENGAEGVFPPAANATVPTGYVLEFEMMGEEDALVVEAENDLELIGLGSYLRWRGRLAGKIGENGTAMDGYGFWEQFNIALWEEGQKAALEKDGM